MLIAANANARRLKLRALTSFLLVEDLKPSKPGQKEHQKKRGQLRRNMQIASNEICIKYEPDLSVEAMAAAARCILEAKKMYS